jgi:AraC-like DNA-binding protein
MASTHHEEEPFYKIADQFINLANEIAATAGSAAVGTAIRYAAARYNTFEASLGSTDLAADRDKFITMLCDDFRAMLGVNMDDYIQRLQQQDTSATPTPRST